MSRADGKGALSQSHSDDDGANWSHPVRITEPAEHPGDAIKLSDGRVLLTYGRRTTPCGIFGLVSHDDGKTWDEDNKLFLVADAGNDQGYPSSIQRDDGTVVTVYYSNRLVVPGGARSETIGIHGAAVIYHPEDLP